MARDIDISVLGDKKLQKSLNALEPKLRKKAMQGAMKIAMEPVLRKAKGDSPVKTGRMRRHLRIKNLKSNRKFIGVIVQHGTRKSLKIDPKDEFFYPAAIEFGTDHIKGKPFLRNALNKQTDKVLRLFGQHLEPQIIKMAKTK